MKRLKSAKLAYLLIAACMVALGICLIVYPQVSAMTLCYLFGIMTIVFGVIKLLSYFSNDLYRLAFQFDLALGVFAVVAGVLMLLHPVSVAASIPAILGVFFLVDGAFKLQTALDSKRFGLTSWWYILILAILTCASGIVLLLNPLSGFSALMVLLGITLIIDGIQNFFVVFYTVKIRKGIEKTLQDDRHDFL